MFHGEPLDEPRLRSIHVRIVHLIGKGLNPSVGYATLALIDLLLGNRDSSITHAEEAIQACDKDFTLDSLAFVRATCALFAACLFGELFQKIDQWLANNPYDIPVLKSAIVQSSVLSQFERQQRYESLLKQCPGAILTDMQIHLSQTAEVNRALAVQYGFTEGDILARLNVSVEFLQGVELAPKRIMRQTIDDGSFVFLFYVDTERDRAAELTFEVFDALTEHFEISAMDLFSISCRPFEDWQGPGILKDEV